MGSHPHKQYVLTAFLTITLAGCGGGSGSDGPDPNVGTPLPSNQVPTVNAGPDQSVNEQVMVQLNGSASDPDGSIESVEWSQVSGIGVAISQSESLGASFEAPTVTSTQELRFSLLVTDNSGAEASDEVTVSVSPLNDPPVVDAGNNLGAYEKERITLTSTATDSDGTIDVFEWQQTAGPPVTLRDASCAAATFYAPDVEEITQLTFALTVEDNEGAQSADTVSLAIHPLAHFEGPVLKDTLLNGAYEIGSEVSVAAGTTLTIAPGSVLKLAENVQLSVSGQLLADGTSTDPIFFTYLNYKDDSPKRSWLGIEFNDASDSSVSKSVIEHAIRGFDLNGISPIAVEDNLFRQNEAAITDSGGYQAMRVDRNSFIDNQSVFDGIRVSGEGAFTGNSFTGNPSIFTSGHYFDNTTIEQNSFVGADLVVRAPETGFGYGTVTAIGNWWGTTSESEIASKIIDINDDGNLQQIIYTPFLDQAPAVVGSTLSAPAEYKRPAYVADTTIPISPGPPSSAPTDLSVTEESSELLLTWNNPRFNTDYIEIWRSTNNSLVSSELHATIPGTQYSDSVGADASFFYWIRVVGTNGAQSAFNDTVGTHGTTGPAPENTVTVGDKEWRQVTRTINLTWFQVASVCNETTGICNGSVGSQDFTGWVWASVTEVGEMFSQLTPHPGNLSQYTEVNSTWAPEFFTRFYPTEERATRTLIRGLTRTTYQSPSGPSTQAYAPLLADLTDPTNADTADTTDNAVRDLVYDSTGVWLYKPVPSVELDWTEIGGPASFEVQAITFEPVTVDSFLELVTNGYWENSIGTTNSSFTLQIYLRVNGSWTLFAEDSSARGPAGSTFDLTGFEYLPIDLAGATISGVNITVSTSGTGRYRNMGDTIIRFRTPD